MKQSAVEWFYEKVIDLIGTNKMLDIEFEKAKKMEEQQICVKNINSKKNLKTVLVKYMVYLDASHPLLDGKWMEKSQVIEVVNLADVNRLFANISDVKILK